ncbi:MAG TPA: NUDIX hydrolase [Candidatus Saccharimonadales bacterium]|nr:NUDIX hydrolase [Candidatus Saccharimonadales bacterium]
MDYVIPEKSLRQQATRDRITHLSTGIAIRRNGTLLLVRREPGDFLGGSWELPGGGIDEGETFEQAIRRELLEETGLTVTKIVGMFAGFDYSTDVKPKVRQFNFIVTVAPSKVTLSEEHDTYIWVTLEDLPKLKLNSAMNRCAHEVFRSMPYNNAV